MFNISALIIGLAVQGIDALLNGLLKPHGLQQSTIDDLNAQIKAKITDVATAHNTSLGDANVATPPAAAELV